MLVPISVLKKALDIKLGRDQWKDFETETLIIELGLPFSDLLHDKISVLKVIEHKPTAFFDEIFFTIQATNVINNNEADFEHLPHITSLELAFAIVELSRILGVDINHLPEFGIGPTAYIRDLLIEEGFSEVIAPFDIVGLGALPKGQTVEDTAKKEKAIKEYINAMYNQSAS